MHITACCLLTTWKRTTLPWCLRTILKDRHLHCKGFRNFGQLRFLGRRTDQQLLHYRAAPTSRSFSGKMEHYAHSLAGFSTSSPVTLLPTASPPRITWLSFTGIELFLIPSNTLPSAVLRNGVARSQMRLQMAYYLSIVSTHKSQLFLMGRKR